ncbi:hypothetical protein J6590_007823, partial [Homalodisca vitripennis]
MDGYFDEERQAYNPMTTHAVLRTASPRLSFPSLGHTAITVPSALVSSQRRHRLSPASANGLAFRPLIAGFAQTSDCKSYTHES